MKLMKHITIALVLCAIPAVAVGQTNVATSCENCTHEASVYMGEGGVIATADDAEMVTWVAKCGGVTRDGELEANDDGIVSALWTGDLACMAEGGGTFEIGPVMDGGWFWITDDMNSAVGGLVNKDVLENDAADITSAGDGVTMTMGKGAVYLKETATGRVGILPNILPEAPAEDAAICGPRMNPSWPNAYDRQMTSSCMLGNGRATIRLIGPGSFGASATITNGMVYRPNSGTVTVLADLWLNETGSYSTATDNADSSGPSTASIQKGWAGKTATAQGAGNGENWLTSTFSVSVNRGVGDAQTIPADGSVTFAGVNVTNDGSTSTTSGRAGGDAPVGRALFTIAPDSAYCSRSNNHTAVVNVAAIPGAAATNNVHPPVATGRDAGLGTAAIFSTVAAVVQLRVVCPPSSANAGEELVPDNPFPTDK